MTQAWNSLKSTAMPRFDTNALLNWAPQADVFAGWAESEYVFILSESNEPIKLFFVETSSRASEPATMLSDENLNGGTPPQCMLPRWDFLPSRESNAQPKAMEEACHDYMGRMWGGGGGLPQGCLKFSKNEKKASYENYIL